jgi:hypothetical protein
MRIPAVLLFLLTISCTRNTLTEGDLALLLELHQQQRVAHVSKNAKMMVDQFAEDFISVNHGKIDSVYVRAEDSLRLQTYFDNVNFKSWDDATPPKVRFSRDRSMAYMIVDKLVILETSDSTGKKVEETTRFAWVAIFRKQDSGSWKIECVVSTNRAEETRLL